MCWKPVPVWERYEEHCVVKRNARILADLLSRLSCWDTRDEGNCIDRTGFDV